MVTMASGTKTNVLCQAVMNRRRLPGRPEQLLRISSKPGLSGANRFLYGASTPISARILLGDGIAMTIHRSRQLGMRKANTSLGLAFTSLGDACSAKPRQTSLKAPSLCSPSQPRHMIAKSPKRLSTGSSVADVLLLASGPPSALLAICSITSRGLDSEHVAGTLNQSGATLLQPGLKSAHESCAYSERSRGMYTFMGKTSRCSHFWRTTAALAACWLAIAIRFRISCMWLTLSAKPLASHTLARSFEPSSCFCSRAPTERIRSLKDTGSWRSCVITSFLAEYSRLAR
mmetsp:Transcript_27084/g.59488  ORF Transcript_27084/g.59488 Transcript_27084/m.59488 type:complete len:288 (+) Transcript_27084:34-897(+)